MTGGAASTSARSLADALLAALLAPPCAVCDARRSTIIRSTAPSCDRCWRGASLPSAHPCHDGPRPVACSAAAIGEYDGVLRDDHPRARSTTAAARSAPRAGALMAAARRGDSRPAPTRRCPSRSIRAASASAASIRPTISRAVWASPSARAAAARRPAHGRRSSLPAARASSTTCATRSTAESASSCVARRRARTRRARRRQVLVLVDDVTTTGATLEACARVLTAGGRARGPGAYSSPSRVRTAAEHASVTSSLRRLPVDANPRGCVACRR